MKGGKAGKLNRYFNFSDMNIIGAGGYGIAVKPTRENIIIKLIYDLDSCIMMKSEASVQAKAHKILATYFSLVSIPEIFFFKKSVVSYQKHPYLCGIGMEYLPPPLNYTETIHIILSSLDDQINVSRGRKTQEPISEQNPTRGFFAGPDTLEEIWDLENSEMTIEKMAYLMGITMSVLLNNGIILDDEEWIWANGKPCIIDFGMCREGYMESSVYLEYILKYNEYIPHKDDRGFNEFLMGYNLHQTS